MHGYNAQMHGRSNPGHSINVCLSEDRQDELLNNCIFKGKTKGTFFELGAFDGRNAHGTSACAAIFAAAQIWKQQPLL